MITWKKNNGNFLAYKNNEPAGMVSQNPDDPRVMDPGLWAGSIHPIDGGIVSVVLCNSGVKARVIVANALARGWTYAIWKRWWSRYKFAS